LKDQFQIAPPLLIIKFILIYKNQKKIANTH